MVTDGAELLTVNIALSAGAAEAFPAWSTATPDGRRMPTVPSTEHPASVMGAASI